MDEDRFPVLDAEALVEAAGLVRSAFNIEPTRLRCALAAFFIPESHKRFSFFSMADFVHGFASFDTWAAMKSWRQQHISRQRFAA